MDLGGEFWAEACDLANFVHRCDAQPVDLTEVFQQRGAAHFAQAGQIIQHALPDFFRAELGVIGVGEAVRFVAQALEEVESGMIERQVQRGSLVRKNDRLMFFRETDQGRRRQIESDKRFQCCADLPAAAIDDDEIGPGPPLLREPAVTTGHDFLHGPGNRRCR